DHFKHINDRHGHAAGDQVLVGLVGVVRQRIRAVDTLFRIGGEEFLVIVENADTETAKKLAEDLRVLVEAAGLLDDCSVTISVGVAQLGAGETSDDWLRRGDDALYAAKRAGRNCVVCAEDSACIPGLAPIRHAGKGSA
ncbi:MAG: GGDEF domain-containing protein, partial [Pseudomonadota bacterium]